MANATYLIKCCSPEVSMAIASRASKMMGPYSSSCKRLLDSADVCSYQSINCRKGGRQLCCC